MLRVLGRVVLDAALVGSVLFVSAGTFSWYRAWVLIAALIIVRAFTLLTAYLIQDRAKLPIHRDQPLSDKVLLLGLIGFAFVVLPAIAGLDAFRWHLFPQPSRSLSMLGLFLFVLGWVIQGLALRENAFATTVVRMQRERTHVLIDSGVYRVVRHPFYAGTPLILVGMSLWLGSFAAVLFASIPIALLLLRIRLEEQFLARELTGYGDYQLRVPYRLIPSVW